MRLDTLPDHGKVVLGHPSDEEVVALYARMHNLDYCLSRHVDSGQVFVMNVDLIVDDHFTYGS